MPYPIIDRAFSIDPSALLPAITAETAPYWEGLEKGEIRGLQCADCGTTTLPGGPVCAQCGSGALIWRTLSGDATLFAWVRYHRPYLPEFADILPYVSAIVELPGGGQARFAADRCGGRSVYRHALAAGDRALAQRALRAGIRTLLKAQSIYIISSLFRFDVWKASP